MNRSILLIVVAALAPQLAGCVAVAAAGVVGVGYVQYHRNEVEHDFPDDLERTWYTTLESLRRMGVHSPTAVLASTEGTIDFDDVHVRVERHPGGLTRVRIRVGTFHTSDHQRRAELLMKQITDTMNEEDEFREWTERVRDLDQPEDEQAPAPR